MGWVIKFPEKITFWACFLELTLKITFDWKANLFIFFRSSFKFFADKVISRATKKRDVSTSSLEIETKLSKRSLINIKKKMTMNWSLRSPALTSAYKEYWTFKMVFCFQAYTIPYKIPGTFLYFSIVSVYCEWNRARLLSPEVEGARLV